MNPSPRTDEALFSDVLARPTHERAAFLDGACGADAALRGRLDALLAAHEGTESLMAAPALKRPAALSDLSAVGLANADLSAVLSAVGLAKVEGLAKAEEKPGDWIGRYKLLQKIGEGGCGMVWMAEQEEPVRRRIALKVIKLGMDTKAVVARFEAERQALAIMDHPNIAKVHDAGATETGRPFFVMELVRGIPITKYCDENHLNPTARLELFIKVCQAVQHAHQKGIIHRDLKPSNILVTVNDGAPTPKVIDFGIAKATQGRLTDATVFTAFEQFIGTPVYMSPEQAEMSSLDIDARSDVYSLGILLYELLTGQPPFDPKALADAGVDRIRQQIREVEPPRPSRRLSTLGDAERTTIARLRRITPVQLSLLLRGDLDWIVMCCLEKDRTRRYQTASELAADVRRHLEHEPVLARPPTMAYRFRKFARRHRVGLAAAGFSIAALAAGALISRWHTIQSVEQERNAAHGPVASLAVLAFANLNGERENEYFSDGISDELINILEKVPRLRVAARTSAFSYRGKSASVQEIGAKLGVTYVVDGSMRSAGGSVHIAVRLWRAATGEQIWGEVYGREGGDIFAVRDEMAHSIVTHVRGVGLESQPEASRRIRSEVRTAARGRTQIVDAYALFLRGRFKLVEDSRPALEESIRILQQAVTLDPSFALAWAELSNAHRNLATLHGLPSFEEGFRRAREAAERALQLEPDLPEAHSSLMLIRIHHDYDWAAAEREKQRALAFAPNNVGTLSGAAMLAIARGHSGEATLLARRAVEVDPLNAEARGILVSAHLLAGRVREAESEARRSDELGVDSLVARYWWSVIAVLDGRIEEARQISAKTDDYVRLMIRAVGEYAEGNRAESNAALDELIAKHAQIAAYQAASVYAMRGEAEKAFVWLEHARERRDSGLPFVKMDPLLRNLHGDPRWVAFLKTINLAD